MRCVHHVVQAQRFRPEIQFAKADGRERFFQFAQ